MARLRKLAGQGLIKFGKNEKLVPRGKRYLTSLQKQVPPSVLSFNSQASVASLRKLLKNKVRVKPLDLNLLTRLLHFCPPANDALVLDFSGRLGCTAAAVLQYNQQNKTSYRYLLATGKVSKQDLPALAARRLKLVAEQIAAADGLLAGDLGFNFIQPVNLTDCDL